MPARPPGRPRLPCWLPQVRVPWSELLVWQRVNHFLEAKQLTRKDLLKKHLVRYQAGGGSGKGGEIYLLGAAGIYRGPEGGEVAEPGAGR